MRELTDDVMLLIGAVKAYEEYHGSHKDGWTCFRPVLDKLPKDLLLEALLYYNIDQKYRTRAYSDGWRGTDPPIGFLRADDFNWFTNDEYGGIYGIPRGVTVKGVPE